MKLQFPSRRPVFRLAVWAVFLTCARLAQAAPMSYSDAVLSNNPIAYYRLGESSGTAADNLGTTGSTNDGTYVNGPGLGQAGALYGEPDTAVSFGASYPDYMVTNPFGSFPASAISVELWMKGTSNAEGIVSYAPTNSLNNELLLFDSNNLRPHINNLSTVYSGVDVNDNLWHHVVMTWRNSDGQLEVYKDGVREFVTSGIKTGYNLVGNGALVLAQEQDAVAGGFDSNQRFIGTLDEVAVYDTVLSATDVARHYHAARSGVVAANISVPTSTTNAGSVWTVDQGGPGPIGVVSTGNVGDAEIGVGGVRLLWSEGVMMATVRENGRGGVFGNVEVANTDHFTSDSLGIATSQAGAGGGGELNINVAVAHFPFEGDWTGGHVNATGTLIAGHNVNQGMLTHVSSGMYELTLPGVHSIDDGMLFVVGASNEDNMANTYPLSDGSGWRINVQDSNANYSSEQDDFSFLYVPYANTAGLVGGLVDYNGTIMASKGDFTLTHPSTGTYRLSIPGKSPDDGMLLLTLADEGDLSLSWPDDNMLLYEADGSDFLIRARDLDALTAFEDTRFVFAYVDFTNPLYLVPEPTAGVALWSLFAALGTLLGYRGVRGKSGG